MPEVAELNAKATLALRTAVVTDTCSGAEEQDTGGVAKLSWVRGRNQKRLHEESDL